MEVRIIKNPIGYDIQVKKYWWSRWKTVLFEGNGAAAIEKANVILYKHMSKRNDS